MAQQPFYKGIPKKKDTGVLRVNPADKAKVIQKVVETAKPDVNPDGPVAKKFLNQGQKEQVRKRAPEVAKREALKKLTTNVTVETAYGQAVIPYKGFRALNPDQQRQLLKEMQAEVEASEDAKRKPEERPARTVNRYEETKPVDVDAETKRILGEQESTLLGVMYGKPYQAADRFVQDAKESNQSGGIVGMAKGLGLGIAESVLRPASTFEGQVGNMYDPDATAEERLGAIGNAALYGGSVLPVTRGGIAGVQSFKQFRKMGAGAGKALAAGAESGAKTFAREAIPFGGNLFKDSSGLNDLAPASLRQDVKYNQPDVPVSPKPTPDVPSFQQFREGAGINRIADKVEASGAFASTAEKEAFKQLWSARANTWATEAPGRNVDEFYRQFEVSVDQQIPQGAMRQDPTYGWNPQDEVTTRVVTGAKPLVDPQSLRTTSLDDISLDPAYEAKLLAAMRKSDPALANATSLNEAVDLLGDNLMHLYENSSPAVREIGKLWYDGGHEISKRWAERYGKAKSQMAGMLAVYSPQTDWFMNVSRAERTADILANHADEAWNRAMSNIASTKMSSVYTPDEIKFFEGKSLNELPTSELKAKWLRAYDEAHFPRNYRSVTPDGKFGEFMKTGKGERASMAWGDFGSIAKAIDIWNDGSLANISSRLGVQHKVRNFYNNLASPNSPLGHFTSDTHNAAASHLMPLAGSDAQVGAMLGGGPSNANLGYSGTYPVYHQAGINAAERAGVLPREMQSITWETVRSLFAVKSPKAKAEVAQIWADAASGKINRAEAWNRLLEKSGGIGDPNWLPDLRSASATRSSYLEGDVLGASGVSKSAGMVGGDGSNIAANASRLESGESKLIVPDEVNILLQEGYNLDPKGFYDKASQTLGFFTGKSDFSTTVHESFHAWTDSLKDVHKAALEKQFGKIGTTEYFEGSARAFERYLRNGQAPTPALKQIFETIKDTMRSIYARIKGTPLEGKLNPEVKNVFDEMLGGGKKKPDLQPEGVSTSARKAQPAASQRKPFRPLQWGRSLTTPTPG